LLEINLAHLFGCQIAFSSNWRLAKWRKIISENIISGLVVFSDVSVSHFTDNKSLRNSVTFDLKPIFEYNLFRPVYIAHSLFSASDPSAVQRGRRGRTVALIRQHPSRVSQILQNFPCVVYVDITNAKNVD
jgi:hypothetical protein